MIASLWERESNLPGETLRALRTGGALVSARAQSSVECRAMGRLDISSDQFRRLAEHVTRLATDYFQDIDSRSISPASSGQETEALFHTELPEKGLGENALGGLQDVIKHSRAQNGRF